MNSPADPLKWLFVTSQFPWPIMHGQWLRVYHLARALRHLGDEVFVLSSAGVEMTAAAKNAYETLGVTILDGPSGAIVSQGRSRTFLGPYAFDSRMAEAVSQHSRSMDVVVLSHLRMIQYSQEAAQSSCVIADVGDDPVLEYARRQKAGIWKQDWLRRIKLRIGRIPYERRGLDNTDVAVFVSDADADSFRKRHPHTKALSVSNGVDIEYFRRPNDQKTSELSPSIIFTGHMGNPNNRLAAEYLVQFVAPIVWTKMPNVRVQIVGAEPTEEILALANDRVEVTGTVPDIRPYLWKANLMTLTMRSGTGIKNKLLEGWAAGTAVVATSLASQGVNARDGENLALADSAEEFAAKVVELLSDDERRARIGKEGRRTVEQSFTWNAASARLRAIAASQVR